MLKGMGIDLGFRGSVGPILSNGSFTFNHNQSQRGSGRRTPLRFSPCFPDVQTLVSDAKAQENDVFFSRRAASGEWCALGG